MSLTSLDPSTMGTVQRASYLRQIGEKPKRKKSKASKPKEKSKLEETLWLHMRQAKIADGWVREHVFHAVRKWRFDFAHLESKLAIECEGLLPASKGGGGHQRPEGYSDDCEKYNAALVMGWRVLRFTRKHIIKEASAVRVIREALG